MSDITSLGSLTTAFIPDPSCTVKNNVWYIWPETGFPYWQYGPPLTSNCFPSNYTPVTTAYYSPGSCPEYYTSADISTVISGSITETVVTCCPSGPSLTANRGSESLYVGWPNLRTMACTRAFDENKSWPTVTKSSAGETTLSSATWLSGGGGVQAYGIIVRFQATDVASATLTDTSSTPTTSMALSASPITSSLTAIPTSSSASKPISSPESTQPFPSTSIPPSSPIPTSTSTTGIAQKSPETSKLSEATKAGIGSGVAAALIISIVLSAAVTYHFMKRRKNTVRTASIEAYPDFIDKRLSPVVYRSEVPGDSPHEFLPELYSHPRPPQEMSAEGTWFKK